MLLCLALWKIKRSGKVIGCKAIRASQAGKKIPENRCKELSVIVQKHFTSASSPTPEMIMQVATMDTCMKTVKFVSHKFEVVKDFARKGNFWNLRSCGANTLIEGSILSSFHHCGQWIIIMKV